MVRLLHYSDVENVYDDPVRAGRLAGLVQALDGPDALIAGTGDDTAPGVLSMVERGRQALEFFRAVGADLETFGNHDFDWGLASTRGVVRDAPQTWVSANVFDGDEPFAAAEGVVPWTVERVDDGRETTTVGFVGVTDPATDAINPDAADLTFTDPIDAVEGALAELRARGVDHVVVLSHLGAGDDDLAAAVDVDVILGGHVHTERCERVAGTLLTRPGVNGRAVWEVHLGDGDPEAVRHDPADADPDPDLVSALTGRVEAAGLDETVGVAETPLVRDEASVFGGESRIGNLVADAYRWDVGADVALLNSGGIRTGPPLAGEVSLADLISVLPFEEHVVEIELTGAQLLEAFRQAAGPAVDFGEPGWWHGHVSGAEIVWDDERGDLEAARVGGEPIVAGATYSVATSEFLLHTDREFPALEPRHRVDEGGIQHDVLAAYAREHGLDVEVQGRIRRSSP
ncbi:MAG: bifunctional UDP-sugar hydrolase/5'-nucleotidase [Haloferacaceae archaeon]